MKTWFTRRPNYLEKKSSKSWIWWAVAEFTSIRQKFNLSQMRLKLTKCLKKVQQCDDIFVRCYIQHKEEFLCWLTAAACRKNLKVLTENESHYCLWMPDVYDWFHWPVALQMLNLNFKIFTGKSFSVVFSANWSHLVNHFQSCGQNLWQ